MDNIKDVVNRVIGGLVCQAPEGYQHVHDAWAQIVDPQTARHTRVAGVKHDQLTVYVDSPAWLYQMNLQKEKLLQQLKKDLPKLKRILFKIGKVSG